MTNHSDVESLLNVLRRSGYKITRARRVVIEVLATSSGHITAPEVVAAVRLRAPGVGRASVYRTLDLLICLGLAQASTLGGSTTTYVLAPSGHHHHLVCTGCGATVEFEQCVLGELEQHLAETLGFQVERHLVEIYGRCADCQSVGEPSTSGLP